jgi:RNA polymerase sigma-70 factor (ECF subfamily)
VCGDGVLIFGDVAILSSAQPWRSLRVQRVWNPEYGSRMSRPGNSVGADERSKLQWFATTHWSVVLSAKEADAPRRQQALEALCRAYWPPIYTFIRQRGYSPHDAQDLTQEFFARLLEKDYLQHLTHQQGRFRTFLLTFVNHLLSDERDKRQAQKRGGGRTHLPLENVEALETQLAHTGPAAPAETAFDRQWARTVVDRANQRLAEEYRTRGKEVLYRELKTFAPTSQEQPAYDELARKLAMTEQAVRAAVHRMRGRFGQLIRDEVSHTVRRPDELEEEIRYLISVLAGT